MSETDDDRPLRNFLVECYASPIERGTAAAAGDRLSRAARELRRRGRAIDYIRAIVVPDDEVAFHLFLARDAGVVREAVTRARMTCERIVESIVVEAAPGPTAVAAD
jgi:hypothetical protein